MRSKRTILVADPAESLVAELQPFFKDEGFDAVHVKNLKETLLAIQSQSVDVLILDSGLLSEDCGFISIIKGMEEDLPIIICAEVNTPEFESKIRKQRIFYYHIKSFGVQDLEMAISNAVGTLSN